MKKIIFLFLGLMILISKNYSQTEVEDRFKISHSVGVPLNLNDNFFSTGLNGIHLKAEKRRINQFRLFYYGKRHDLGFSMYFNSSSFDFDSVKVEGFGFAGTIDYEFHFPIVEKYVYFGMGTSVGVYSENNSVIYNYEIQDNSSTSLLNRKNTANYYWYKNKPELTGICFASIYSPFLLDGLIHVFIRGSYQINFFHLNNSYSELHAFKNGFLLMAGTSIDFKKLFSKREGK